MGNVIYLSSQNMGGKPTWTFMGKVNHDTENHFYTPFLKRPALISSHQEAKHRHYLSPSIQYFIGLVYHVPGTMKGAELLCCPR